METGAVHRWHVLLQKQDVGRVICLAEVFRIMITAESCDRRVSIAFKTRHPSEIPLVAERIDMTIIGLSALLLLAASGARGHCIRNGVRCLEYTVLRTDEDGRYEERSYPSIVWVSATADAKDKSDVTRPLIILLYAYLNGTNDRGEKLKMMVPVRTKKVVNDDINTYTLSLALLPEQSEHPPEPTHPDVTLLREPSAVYITTSFGGRAREDTTWDSHADNLKNALSDDDSVDTSFYYMSVYDSPWRETDRLNEVWMVKEEQYDRR